MRTCSAHLVLGELLPEWARPEGSLPGGPRTSPLGRARAARLGALAQRPPLPTRGSPHHSRHSSPPLAA